MSYSLEILKHNDNIIYDLTNDSMGTHKLFDTSFNTVVDWSYFFDVEYDDIYRDSENANDSVTQEEYDEIFKKLRELI